MKKEMIPPIDFVHYTGPHTLYKYTFDISDLISMIKKLCYLISIDNIPDDYRDKENFSDFNKDDNRFLSQVLLITMFKKEEDISLYDIFPGIKNDEYDSRGYESNLSHFRDKFRIRDVESKSITIIHNVDDVMKKFKRFLFRNIGELYEEGDPPMFDNRGSFFGGD